MDGPSIEEAHPANPLTQSGPVYRQAGVKELRTNFDPAITDMWGLMKHNVERFADTPFLGKRQVLPDGAPGDFVFETYAQVFEKIKLFGAGLKKLDLLKRDAEDTFDLMGLACVNRPEWVIAEYGAFSLGATTVPFYTSYGVEEYSYAVDLLSLATICCQSEIAEVLLKAKENSPALKTLILLDEKLAAVPDDKKQRFADAGIELYWCVHGCPTICFCLLLTNTPHCLLRICALGSSTTSRQQHPVIFL